MKTKNVLSLAAAAAVAVFAQSALAQSSTTSPSSSSPSRAEVKSEAKSGSIPAGQGPGAMTSGPNTKTSETTRQERKSTTKAAADKGELTHGRGSWRLRAVLGGLVGGRAQQGEWVDRADESASDDAVRNTHDLSGIVRIIGQADGHSGRQRPVDGREESTLRDVDQRNREGIVIVEARGNLPCHQGAAALPTFGRERIRLVKHNSTPAGIIVQVN